MSEFDEQEIIIEDVPLVGRPVANYIVILVLCAWYVLAVVFVHDLRPGIAEAFVGCLVAALAGMLLSNALILYLKRLTRESHSKKWISSASLMAYPLIPFKGGIEYRLAVMGAFFGSFLLVGFLLWVLHSLFPLIGWPWFHTEAVAVETSVFASWPSAMFICFVGTGIVLATRTILWYRSLDRKI